MEVEKLVNQGWQIKSEQKKTDKDNLGKFIRDYFFYGIYAGIMSDEEYKLTVIIKKDDEEKTLTTRILETRQAARSPLFRIPFAIFLLLVALMILYGAIWGIYSAITQ